MTSFGLEYALAEQHSKELQLQAQKESLLKKLFKF